MSWLFHLQWPAMVVTVIAAWFTGSTTEWRRKWGFWLFLVSNVIWIAWGWSAHAWAVIALQFFLAVLNIRGAKKNEPA
ncbi:MAG TPA: hypothetical protein VKB93_20565 [Thermoanaerobaculia bacterium]|nr:hypothetical protein [Thermoanaerobaculia bacterium]